MTTVGDSSSPRHAGATATQARKATPQPRKALISSVWTQ